jgi:hypothetical protein
MTREEALEKLKTILGKGLHPTAIPKVEEILRGLEEDNFEAGFEQARQTVGDWYEPDYQGNEGYD